MKKVAKLSIEIDVDGECNSFCGQCRFKTAMCGYTKVDCDLFEEELKRVTSIKLARCEACLKIFK
jgi:hypothetical protein